MFKLTFDTTNDAFAEDDNGEMAAILRRVADYIEHTTNISGPVRDSNGNTVGSWLYLDDNHNPVLDD